MTIIKKKSTHFNRECSPGCWAWTAFECVTFSIRVQTLHQLNYEVRGAGQLRILFVYCRAINDTKRKVWDKFSLNQGLNNHSSGNSGSSFGWTSSETQTHYMTVRITKFTTVFKDLHSVTASSKSREDRFL